ncbi:MAG: EF-hand domain-containing protein [Desulfarculales bacterium]|jgi:Ca2+-binding EF-hand superfamily protein|nr:EF-hand domain-containing protein [Desulfarculales bacterium]
MSINTVSASGANYYQEIFTQLAKNRKEEQETKLSDLFTKLDADGNESLSLEETGLDETIYNSLDSDKDGTVSLAEFKDALTLQFNTLMAQKQSPPAGMLGFSSSQEVDTSEAQKILADILSGKPVAASGGGGSAQSSFDALDTNQDGIVSAEELMAGRGQQFSILEDSLKNADSETKQKIMDLLLSLANKAYNAVSKTAEENMSLVDTEA